MSAQITDPDERRVHRAAVTMTRQITLATCLVVLLIVAAAVAVVLLQMRPEELAEPARPGEAQIHLDATETVLALAAVAVATIGYALIISWVISRRAVRPLAHALQVQRAFVADASHELRTPLAVLDARVQLLGHQLERGDAADSTRATTPDPGHDPGDSGGTGVRETVVELRDDTRQLIAIVNDLLAAAGGEDAGAEAVITDASRVVGETVESLRVLAGSLGIELGCAVPEEPVPVTMPASGLRRCVTSLIDNAMAHSAGSASAQNGPVETRLAISGGKAVLTVTDHGPGVRGIDPERIFHRFAHADPPPATASRDSDSPPPELKQPEPKQPELHRPEPGQPESKLPDSQGLESQRPASQRGFGIGLALVRELAEGHGGSVRVARTGPEGTVMELILPLSGSAPTTE